MFAVANAWRQRQRSLVRTLVVGSNFVPWTQLAERPYKEIDQRFGGKKQVEQALAQAFRDLTHEHQVKPEDVKPLFRVAHKARLRGPMLRLFYFMEEHCPRDIDFAMYGQVFTALSQPNHHKQMFAVYERARAKYKKRVPAIIYRFGIVAKLDAGDLDGAHKLVDEMVRETGAPPSNEVLSRMMLAHAKQRDSSSVLELLRSIEEPMSSVTTEELQAAWHVADMDRVITSLGIIEQPELAFKFYRMTQKPLSSSTLVALLNVCRHNQCERHANAILLNRKRFDLTLDARAYNAILETVETFRGKRKELLDVLEEMRRHGVKHDRLTRQIIERNQPVLRGTRYAHRRAEAKEAGAVPAQPGSRE